MIPARKRPYIEAVFSRLNRRMLRRHFHALHLSGLEQVARLDRTRPIVFFGNHSCWWDGLLEFYLSREVFGLDAYLMMEERQFVRYRFFRWIGAFSVKRESPRDAVRSLRYAASLFDRPDRAVWIYPQGIMRPNDARPLSFFTGAARLAQMVNNAQLVPVAHRYEFLAEQRPDLFTAVGAPLRPETGEGPQALTRRIESVATELLDGLRSCVIAGKTEAFRTVLRGRTSTNVTYDRVRAMERP